MARSRWFGPGRRRCRSRFAWWQRRRRGSIRRESRGVRQSKGEWIAFIDDDCLLEPDWIREASRFIAEHPDAGAFGCQVVLQWEAAPPSHVDGYGYAFAETRLGDAPLRRDWLAGAGMVLRRSAVQATGWLDGQFLDDRIGHRLVSGGDVELGLRVGALFEIWYAPRCVLHHSIPLRRTERRYLRRLVFGLGRSSHGVDVLCWASGAMAWWPHAIRRGARFAALALRRAAGDAVHRRSRSDPMLAAAFAAGWVLAMASFAVPGATARRRIMGRLAPSPPRTSRDRGAPAGATPATKGSTQAESFPIGTLR